MKAGTAVLVGRASVGKSTLLNNLLGHKVAITSPKPQTTRFLIEAVYEDNRGQIIFVDTPGLTHSVDSFSKTINQGTVTAIQKADFTVIVYIIDPTRPRNSEDNKLLGLVRKFSQSKILVVNKSDLRYPDYWADYAFYKEEFPNFVRTSALNHSNLNILLEMIFNLLPKRSLLVDTSKLTQPGLNLDSQLFVSEIIREKVFLTMREEIPYTVKTLVDNITERPNGVLYIKGRIITTADRYKSMLIGRGGKVIKEIGTMTRKELEAATNKKIFLDLLVQVDPNWQMGY